MDVFVKDSRMQDAKQALYLCLQLFHMMLVVVENAELIQATGNVLLDPVNTAPLLLLVHTKFMDTHDTENLIQMGQTCVFVVVQHLISLCTITEAFFP